MPLLIVRDNIVHMKTDAIVNAANEWLHPGGGVCGSIFDRAGYDKMLAACQKIGSCNTGQAVITPGFDLPARYVIHAVGPRWKNGQYGEENLLRSAYKESLQIAKAYHLKSLAFPLLSSGIYGYPKDEALRVAVAVISEFVLQNDMDVYLVMYDRQSFALSEQLVAKVDSYIDDCYVQSREKYRHLRPDGMDESFCVSQQIAGQFAPSPQAAGQFAPSPQAAKQSASSPKAAGQFASSPQVAKQSAPLPKAAGQSALFHKKAQPKAASGSSLTDLFEHMDETFSESLLHHIDEQGKKDSEVYSRANIDRRLFSKIRTNKDYKPSKQTAVAFCIALELPIEEADDLLAKAGYVLTHTNKFDIIVEYYIKSHNYDIFELNEVLFHYDQPLLGSVST